ncbi:type I restriction enzyme S subunit [Humitalea rosea]|uniref:Type I restriction enzyme S subunit n=1 Tax=Humitalea rosea TaxID=990373 RepID=A0A2W7IHR6_9PROT|nr:restriction endonuclease subunit S [Humitalea rosea]PZW36966.1 type I restriction enzyme S subunit [Humitalea rosea]
MSFPAYLAYQDSGISWIGPVPAGWSVKRLRFLAQVQTGIAKGKDVQGIETIRVPYLRVANVQDGFIDIDDVSEIEIAASDLGRYLLRPGDVLMNEGGDFDKLGRGQVWNSAIDPCIHQNHVFAVRPHGIEPEWLALVTSADCGRFFFMTRAKQSTNLASISSTNLLELPVPCPPPAERRAIMRFLDRETGKIDALVAEQERLIALLKEKRQAVISQAVTKGLDASAPMKESGVAWLGQVPAHWEIVPSTWLFAEGRERAHADDQQLSATQKYGVIPQAEFELLEGRQVTHALMHLDQRKHVEVDNFVISMRSFEGGIERVRNRGCVRSSYITLIASKKAKPSYFSYVFKSKPYIQGLQTTANFIRDGQDLNYGNFRQVPLPLPPGDEQENIAALLIFETNRADALIVEAHRAIALLRERRAALISAAVTGKIDVRGLAAVPQKNAAAA